MLIEKEIISYLYEIILSLCPYNAEACKDSPYIVVLLKLHVLGSMVEVNEDDKLFKYHGLLF